jgi:peptidoglycan hydrolase-like protein with peptidoglycan-binding domain
MRNIMSKAALSLTAAVKAFQKKVNPPVDGIVGP